MTRARLLRGQEHAAALEPLVEGERRASDAAAPSDRHALVLLPKLDADAEPARAGRACRPDDGARAADQVVRLEIGAGSAIVADPAMAQLFALVRRLADSDVPVLVVGETGVGKEHAAQALHAWSRRAHRPLIALNCAALTDALAESELFGHERGAFTGAVGAKLGQLEAADGGTVFLDEVGELPLHIQAKLLRALESKRVLRIGSVHERAIDVRFVAATNRKLEAEVAAGRFRQDLYFRLRGAKLALPPLRDRPRDLAVLTRSFLAEACAERGRSDMTCATATMDAVMRHAWPGNVRELKNEMQYVAATADGRVVEPWHLSEAVVGLPEADRAAPGPAAPPPAAPLRALSDELRELERRRMAEALTAAGGVQKRAAELIAMPLRTFRMKAKQHGLDRR